MPLKICYDNQADLATVSEENSNLQLPPSNVQDQRLSRIYQGGESINFNIYGSGAPKTISQAYTNLITFGTDLADASWTKANGATAVLSTLSINGNLYTKIGSTTGTADPVVSKSVTITATSPKYSIIVNRGNMTIESTELYCIIGTATNRAVINWGTNGVSLTIGTRLDYTWIDDDTVEIYYQATYGTTTTAQFRIDPVVTTGDSATYIYVTECQLVDNTTTMFPYVDGTHAIDVIDETFTMPDKFIIDITFGAKYSYDTAIPIHNIFGWIIDPDNEFKIEYVASVDKFALVWDETNNVIIFSDQFDDGSSFIDINQKLRITVSADLTSVSTTSSRFILLEEDGTVHEYNTWSASPAAKLLDYPTLSIGNNAGSSQADSVYEYLRIYEGLLVGTISDSNDVDDLLSDKKIIYEAEYMSRLTATDLLIANSTINDGDTITLRGNDWDSFNSGTPVDESVTWSKDIIKHTFTKGSYQYWRLSVNSSNDISIGRLSLGPCYTTPGIAYLIPQDINSATKKTYGVAGQAYGDKRYFFDQVSARWPDLSEDEKDDLIEILKTVDISTPFFITYDKAGATLGTMYVTFDFKTLKITPLGKRNLYTATAKFREEVK